MPIGSSSPSPAAAGGSAARAAIETPCHQPGERLGAVADRMLPSGVAFPEGQGMPVGDEHRVVAEAAVAARRPHRLAMHLPLHRFGVAVRPGEAEGAGEPGPPVAGAGSQRSEERRVGKECVSTCRSWWSPVHLKKKTNKEHIKSQ